MGFYNDRILSCIIHQSMASHRLDSFRESLLEQASGKSLEIGIGSGANLPFYPKQVSHIVGLDNNKAMLDRLDPSRLRHQIPLEVIIENAEGLPFKAEEFDTVISTFTLCSISNPIASLSEIIRVLKPGGNFLFLEHGRSSRTGMQKIQKMMDSFHPFIAGGCHVGRDIFRLIDQAGLTTKNRDNSVVKFLPAPYRHFYSGRGGC